MERIGLEAELTHGVQTRCGQIAFPDVARNSNHTADRSEERETEFGTILPILGRLC